MNSRYRLKKSVDFKRVRRLGRSYAHPFIMLVAFPNDSKQLRFAVSAGRVVGNAVQRNHAKRLMRAAVQTMIESLSPGWDVLLLARHPMANATFQETFQALTDLMNRANLLGVDHGN